MWHTPPQNLGKMLPNRFGSDFRHLTTCLKTFLTGSIFTIWGGCAIWSQYKEIFQNFENFEEFKNDATICLKSLPNRFGSIFPTFWEGCAIWSQYKEIFQKFENFEELKNNAIICLKSLPNPFGSIFPTFWGGVYHMVAIQGNFSKF